MSYLTVFSGKEHFKTIKMAGYVVMGTREMMEEKWISGCSLHTSHFSYFIYPHTNLEECIHIPVLQMTNRGSLSSLPKVIKKLVEAALKLRSFCYQVLTFPLFCTVCLSEIEFRNMFHSQVITGNINLGV